MQGLDNDVKIGIIGVGKVGGSVQKYFETKDFELFIYDKDKSLGSLEDVNKADVVFVCVPTPYKEGMGCDISIIEDVIGQLTGEKVVVVKSTIPPGTTEYLSGKYPKHRILFNPEFLRESKSNYDMQNPDRQLVGYTKGDERLAKEVLGLLPRAPFERVLGSGEAEMVKYFGNTYLATRVSFAVSMFEICEKLGISYDTVRSCVQEDPRIGPSHLDVYHGGYLGYGGKCLPKDIKALIEHADKLGVNLELHKAAESINKRIMDEQGVVDPESLSAAEVGEEDN